MIAEKRSLTPTQEIPELEYTIENPQEEIKESRFQSFRRNRLMDSIKDISYLTYFLFIPSSFVVNMRRSDREGFLKRKQLCYGFAIVCEFARAGAYTFLVHTLNRLHQISS